MGAKKLITIIFLIFAIVLQSIGGVMDIMDKDRIGCISKQHVWSDGIFLLLLAILINVV